jgi:Predicted transcriptional regulators
MPYVPLRQLIDAYTIKDLAEMLGVNAATLQYRIAAGKIPAPTRQPLRSRRMYYNKDDVENIVMAHGNNKEVK